MSKSELLVTILPTDLQWQKPLQWCHHLSDWSCWHWLLRWAAAWYSSWAREEHTFHVSCSHTRNTSCLRTTPSRYISTVSWFAFSSHDTHCAITRFRAELKFLHNRYNCCFPTSYSYNNCSLQFSPLKLFPQSATQILLLFMPNYAYKKNLKYL